MDSGKVKNAAGEATSALVAVKVAEKPRGRGIWHWVVFPVHRIGKFLFRSRDTDFEKQLQHLTKEEVIVHARIKRRTANWRKAARAIVVYSLVIEIVILGISIMMTWSENLVWSVRALRVLPVFVFPSLACFLYTCCSRFNRMRERKDYQTLERLRSERQAKIDELKERTNYYATQQLIQQYDTDPMAKAAAASILVAKLGAETGLKTQVVLPGDDVEVLGRSGDNRNAPPGASSATQYSNSIGDGEGLRRRRTSSAPAERMVDIVGRGPGRDGYMEGTEREIERGMEEMAVGAMRQGAMLRSRGGGMGGAGQGEREIGDGARLPEDGSTGQGIREDWVTIQRNGRTGEDLGRSVSERRRRGERAAMGGWVARVAAMLVGEDPTQCYALVCENCHMHNGLARKEDFPYITYFCPRCNHLNKADNYGPEVPQSQAPSPLERPLVRRESDFHVHEGPAPKSLSFGNTSLEIENASRGFENASEENLTSREGLLNLDAIEPLNMDTIDPLNADVIDPLNNQ